MTTEQGVIQQERKLIPADFVQLKSSAEDFGKPGHERYFFTCQSRHPYFDITLELMVQRGLARGQNC
ncbi:11683_t:CDS:2 [Ambispora gerdemannii]|uniref:11683_t:CDS:1 n=1 Tax=Ambispora gerdemannii TaxID=144530 RepID=A0A9N8Z0R9_9GLOM|nr:11683_t:CDS:2 [Ambispora gerdemannii]